MVTGLPKQQASDLAKVRKAGASAQTTNHYRSAIRAFCRWMVESGRLRSNPVAGVKPYRADSDRRYERRPLEPNELARLVAAAEQGPDIDGVPGFVELAGRRIGLRFQGACQLGLLR